MQTTTQISRISQLGDDDLKPFINHHATDAELQDYWGKDAAAIRDLAAVDEPAVKGGDSLIILLPGLMGSLLEDMGDFPQLLWINPLAYARGHINRLDIAENGVSAAQGGVSIQPRGLTWLAYAKLLLQLKKNYEVTTFPYDWRLATWNVIQDLKDFIDAKLAQSQFDKVTLVGHSLGGLLSMDYILGDLTRAHAEQKVRRMISLGTPFRGAVAPVKFLAQGGEGDAKMEIIQALNPNNNVLQMLRSWPVVYEILPAPRGVYDDWNPVVDADIWNPDTWVQQHVPINYEHLERAKAHHNFLAQSDPQVDVFCVAGALYSTPLMFKGTLIGGLIEQMWEGLRSGDGTVPIASAVFGKRPSWYVHEVHTELVLERTVIDAIGDWVDGHDPDRLVKRIEDVVKRDQPMRGGLDFEAAQPVTADEIARKTMEDRPLDHEELKVLSSVM